MSALGIQLLSDRILVQPDEEKETLRNGLVLIGGTDKSSAVEGVVAAVGVGKRDKDGKLIPLDVKVGDRVLYGKYFQGGTIKVEDQEYFIMTQDDILGVLA